MDFDPAHRSFLPLVHSNAMFHNPRRRHISSIRSVPVCECSFQPSRPPSANRTKVGCYFMSTDPVSQQSCLVSSSYLSSLQTGTSRGDAVPRPRHCVVTQLKSDWWSSGHYLGMNLRGILASGIVKMRLIIPIGWCSLASTSSWRRN